MATNNALNFEQILTDAGTGVISVSKPNFTFTGSGGTTTSASGSTITIDGGGGGASGGLQSVQVFTSSGVWNKPIGINKILVEIIGSGGSGGGADSPTSPEGTAAGGGGGGGGYARKWITAPAASEIVTINDGGLGVSDNNPGNPGGTNTFGAIVSATGGGGGQTNQNGSAAGGVGGNGVGGDLNINGQSGRAGPGKLNELGLAGPQGGSGGNSFYGGGSPCLGTDVTNVSSTFFGSGSSGVSDSGSPAGSRSSAPGRKGVCIVWEFS